MFNVPTSPLVLTWFFTSEVKRFALTSKTTYTAINERRCHFVTGSIHAPGGLLRHCVLRRDVCTLISAIMFRFNEALSLFRES